MKKYLDKFWVSFIVIIGLVGSLITIYDSQYTKIKLIIGGFISIVLMLAINIVSRNNNTPTDEEIINEFVTTFNNKELRVFISMAQSRNNLSIVNYQKYKGDIERFLHSKIVKDEDIKILQIEFLETFQGLLKYLKSELKLYNDDYYAFKDTIYEQEEERAELFNKVKNLKFDLAEKINKKYKSIEWIRSENNV